VLSAGFGERKRREISPVGRDDKGERSG